MSTTIDLTSIYATNIMGILLMACLLVCKGWKIHTRKLTSTILLVMIITILIGCIVDPLIFYSDGKPGNFHYFIVYSGNILLYLINIVVGPAFVAIVYEYVNERISRLHINLIYIICSLEALMLLINIFVPIVFYVDDSNVYHRHIFFWVYTLAEVILMFDGVIIYLNAKRSGRNRKYFPVWLFIVPIAVGTVVQAFMYGTSLIWPCVGISVCILIVNLKNEGIIIDKLTGVYNKHYLDSVKESLRKDHDGNFSAIMLDIKDFKEINTKFGHSEGDALLISFASLLTGVIKSSGAVVRITADRFFVLLDSASDYALSNVRLAILNAIEAYNRTSGKEYKLSVAMAANKFNLRDFNVNELLDSYEMNMNASKYGYESPAFKEMERDRDKSPEQDQITIKD